MQRTYSFDRTTNIVPPYSFKIGFHDAACYYSSISTNNFGMTTTIMQLKFDHTRVHFTWMVIIALRGQWTHTHPYTHTHTNTLNHTHFKILNWVLTTHAPGLKGSSNITYHCNLQKMLPWDHLLSCKILAYHVVWH